MNRRVQTTPRLELTPVIGLSIGVCLVLTVQLLEGGSLGSLMQPTAAIIVFGGTVGAVLVSFSRADVRCALRSVPAVFVDHRLPFEETIDRLVRYATRAKRRGLLVLQDELEREPDVYLRKGLGLAVDGFDARSIRDTLEIDELSLEERDERPARVFESAGGYAPTFGILGAVLGLIQVMEHLADPSRLGAGIAVAFVATVYGVGSANVIFLPIATRLRSRVRRAMLLREMVLEGILSIQEGINPRLLEHKLLGYIEHERATNERRDRGRAA